ncbi:hypothetical protein ACQPYK_04090 [Streptosporangium sp. CA-135522]|uniref:hypothetical protein n=1 Tax=Streptosporangium sp. CA-135522 TaxID=3240072 RepID=UPI003D89B9D4
MIITNEQAAVLERRQGDRRPRDQPDNGQSALAAHHQPGPPAQPGVHMMTEGFYVTARYRGRAAALLGPYDTPEEALANEPRARSFAVDHFRDGGWFTYGIAMVPAQPGQPLPLGKLNSLIELTEVLGP